MIKIIQISDCHLMADHGADYCGVDPNKNFALTCDFINQFHAPCDVLIASGDLSEDQSEGAYDYFFQGLAALPCQQLGVIPGNHDDKHMLSRMAKKQGITLNKVITVDSWAIILLDSTKGNESPGFLSGTELDFLSQQLSESREKGIKNFFITLHHQPVLFDEKIDGWALQNRGDFDAILRKHADMNLVVTFGHLHQERIVKNELALFICCPSTAVQFLVHKTEFRVQSRLPQYRCFDILPNGSISSSVVTVDHLEKAT